jgi:hypothetical protein
MTEDPELVILKYDCLNTTFETLYGLYNKHILQHKAEVSYHKKNVLYNDIIYLRHQLFNEYDRLRAIWKIIDAR